jgi:hypothetical protein
MRKHLAYFLGNALGILVAGTAPAQPVGDGCELSLSCSFDAATRQALLRPTPAAQEGCSCDGYVVRRDGTEVFRGSFDGPERVFPFTPDCAPAAPVTFEVSCTGPGGEGPRAQCSLLCPDDNGEEVIIRPLELGTPASFPLDSSKRRVWYKLTAPQALGRLVKVTLTDPDAADSNALYLRWGQLPLPYRFDQAADRSNQAGQELVIPFFQGGTLYLLVQSVALSGASNETTVLAALDEVVLRQVRPASAGRRNLGLLTLTIEGGGFKPGAVFTLRHPITGKSFPMTGEATLLSSGTASAIFDLSSAPAGRYDLIVQVPGLSSEKLEGGFRITDTRLGPLLKVELRGSERYRHGTPDILFLHYTNVGDEAMSSPLFKVVGPQAVSPNLPTEYRLEGEGDFAGDLPQVLGIDPAAGAPLLEPGSSGIIPIGFRVHQNGEGLFRVYLLTPRRNDYVPWDSYAAPAGLTQAAWDSLMPILAKKLGYTWPEYRQALANRAARLALRGGGVNAFSVRESFRFAAREALALATSAVVGQVREAPSGSPLSGKTVVALEEGLVKAFALTDPQGFYSLDWLQAGHTYQIRMIDFDPAVTTTLPAEGDLLGFDLHAAAGANGLVPACPNCGTAGLPDRAILPPEDLFTQVAAFTIQVGQAIDPNAKDGPAGQGGDQHLIGAGDPFWYKINFENVGTDDTFAQKVQVRDQLKSEFLDLGSITPRSVGTFQGPEDGEGSLFTLSERSTSLGNSEGTLRSVGSNGQWDVRVVVKFDSSTGSLDCSFETFNAGTDTKPPQSDPGLGFLPKGGTGFIYFEASPNQGQPEGNSMTNDADITFDGTSTMKTNQTQHTFTKLPPEQAQHPIPADGAQGVPITTSLGWSSRRAGSFDVYLWKRSDQFPQPTRVELPGTTPPAPLEPGTVYLWQVIAFNSNGETDGEQWLFETETDPSPPGPPTDPFPADPTSEVPIDRPLRWTAGFGAASHQVFLWQERTTRPDTPIPASRLQFEPALEARTDYLWQVRALNVAGATDGPVWRFRTGSDPLTQFLRGDVNDDRSLDISDAVVNLSFQFLGTDPPGCLKAADTDGSGVLDITDPVTALSFLFQAGPPPPLPFPECGLDPDPDGLTCDSHVCR